MINNLEICNARELFINKGILNRNILSNKIIYSWVRSKLHNISFEILDNKFTSNSVDLLSIDKKTSETINYLRKINLKNSIVLMINSYGNILHKSNNPLLDFPFISNFCEESIGTTAAGISIATGENSRVIGCEHYNSSLTGFVSDALVIKKSKDSEMVYICLFSRLADIKEHLSIFEELSAEFSKLPVKEEVISNVPAKEVVVSSAEVKKEVIIEENLIKTNSKPVKSDAEMVIDKPELESDNQINNSNTSNCKVFTLSIIEADTIREALDYYSWNMKKTADALGIGRSTLYRKIKEYSIEK